MNARLASYPLLCTVYGFGGNGACGVAWCLVKPCDVVCQIYAKRGFAGYFQGYAATTARNVLAVSLYFGVYEVAKLRATELRQGAPKSTDFLAAGALGGIAYWLFTYPLDVIKSAMQTDAIMPADRKYRGYTDTVKKVRCRVQAGCGAVVSRHVTWWRNVQLSGVCS